MNLSSATGRPVRLAVVLALLFYGSGKALDFTVYAINDAQCVVNNMSPPNPPGCHLCVESVNTQCNVDATSEYLNAESAAEATEAQCAQDFCYGDTGSALDTCIAYEYSSSGDCGMAYNSAHTTAVNNEIANWQRCNQLVATAEPECDQYIY